MAASTGLMVAYAPAQAALLGDTVSAELSVDGLGTVLDETDTVVDDSDSEVEFTFIGVSEELSLDVKNDSFDIIYENFGIFSNIIDSTQWVLSDLDWVDTPGIITGVSLSSGNNGLISGTSFTDDSITVEIESIFLGPVAAEGWSFDIETSKVSESVPEPGTILGLLTLAGLGFGSRLKRKIG
ncbi:PEP-CTERM sorting domain-containing protein [Crocosphaera sp.]|uniref:PEP-CTERM sorting domain-containing protein n=1 Tax=Crocosphaera sp. TaxID=2729996 RepID=UPI003F1F24AB